MNSNSYAVVKFRGKSFIVRENEYITVPNMGMETGESFFHGEIIMIKNEDKIIYGKDKNLKLEFNVKENFKGKKVIAYHKTRRSHNRSKTRGSRTLHTSLILKKMPSIEQSIQQ